MNVYHLEFGLPASTNFLQSLQKNDTSHLSSLKLSLFSNSSIFIRSQKLDIVV
ncbi:hypothetical protein HOF65_03335 [bacterium]|nr:hypothetical protein [bacterium]MBT3853022.1 hypothetical protein [bacterium]MBT4633111.1 hypothetical protein [bacterium]MBT6778654.1 hypothetical protein [bacterium]